MTGNLSILFTALFCVVVIPASAQESTPSTEAQAQDAGSSNHHPLKNDPTGINWVFSMDEAIETARATNRIVILKPVSFRSSADSDRLSPSSEAQRATSLVDSRVVNLLNRRFVTYYFDMDPLGSQYDERATDLAKDLYPDMRFSSIATPPLLFMTPERKLLGSASNFLTGQELLDRLVEVLNENPTFAKLTPEEEAVTEPVQRAWLLYELRRLDEAHALLDKQQSSEAYYLRVLIAREQSNWKEMKQAIGMVTDSHRRLDIDVENVLRYWQGRNYEGIKAKGQRVARNNPRYQEAMYYLGLAYYHTDNTDKAIETWTQAIESNPKSAWAFRLDLTQGLVKLDPTQYLSEQDVIPSLLDRRYLCPNGSEDLVK